MKVLHILAFVLAVQFTVFAQQKITVEDIYTGAFRAKGMDELQALKNTNQYTVLNYDRSTQSMQINLFDFASLQQISTLIDTKNQPLLKEGIDSYVFSPNEKQILLASNSTQIFRHSFTADYYLYDIASKTVSKLFDFPVQEPTFSPDGQQLAYAKDNNLFVYNLATKATTQLTNDGRKNAIINGITDWVYEEEFAFVRAFDWSKDSKKLAYIKFDESQVPEFSMSVFQKDLYPTIETFKYPKAGEKNSEVSLHVLIWPLIKPKPLIYRPITIFTSRVCSGQPLPIPCRRKCSIGTKTIWICCSSTEQLYKPV